MVEEQERVFYYITTMNETYPQPAMPRGVEDGILKGMYPLSTGGRGKVRVQLLGAGTILGEVRAAADILESDYGIPADVWSVTSFNELRRDGLACERWNLLHPDQPPREAYVTQLLTGQQGPFIVATDYMKAVADQIRQWMPGPYRVLGTDGYGRSDSRRALREFFEVDRRHVVLAALKSLAEEGSIDPGTVTEAIGKLDIDPDVPDPTTC